MDCNRKGCANKARWQIGFRVWARGHPKTSTPLSALAGIAVCEDCKGSAEVSDFMMPEGVAMLNNALAQRGKAPVDPSTAELTFEEIVDGKLYMGPSQN